MRNFLIAAAAVATLSACVSDPITGERKVSNTAAGTGLGAAVGAVGGAVIGAATGDYKDARRGALIGAGIGALSGGGIGLYMDRQEAAIRNTLQASGVSVTRVGDQIVLNLPSNITFDVDRADIKPEFYQVLDSVAIVFTEYDQTLIDIYGHTDSDGSDQYNFQLSQERAQSVADYFASQRVDPRRMLVRGFGESQPVASNNTDAGKAQNRRVEIRIAPLEAT